MTGREVLFIAARDVADLLSLDACIEAVEGAFRLHANGLSIVPGVLGTHVDGGGFHVKTAGLRFGERARYAAKVNANFPANPSRFGLPTIQGLLILFDAVDGCPLAIVDSAELTSRRTAAATAVAVRHLARRDAAVVTVAGCGVQGREHLRAISRVRALSHAFAFDVEAGRAEAFAGEMHAELKVDVRAARDLATAARVSDICVTCTPSRRAILHPGDVAVGALVAGVGADNPEKQELDPDLLAASKVVVDVLDQCVAIGDLHHAIEAGAMRREDVHAELAEVVAGQRPGRTSDEEVIVFDSTGTALEDVAAAVAVYEAALNSGRGRVLGLGG